MGTRKAPVRLSAAELRFAQRELYQRSFYEFVKAAWRHIDPAPFKDNWHVKIICDHFQAVAEGVMNRLLINIPPGSAKSTIGNVLYPAWIWTHSPEKRILSASHHHDLAIRDSKNTRILIKSRWYQSFWPIEIQLDQDAKAKFENTSRGFREASAFGSMTGSRGNIVILDDPHSREDADSAAKRKSAVDNFRQTLPTRINNPAEDAIIVIMQRLHLDDVSGVILDNAALGYDHLCIPMIADGIDRPATRIGWKDHRREGEHMFPDHFCVPDANGELSADAYIAQKKAELGPFAFSGQYQQNPVPATDGFFRAKWFNRFKPDQLPKTLHYYMTSDHAPSGTGDYNVFRVWAVDQFKNLWLVDSFRKKCLMNEALGVKRDETGKASLAEYGALPLIRKWKPLTWYPENDNVWAAIKGFVESSMRETETYCYIEPLPTKGSGDKVGKAQALQSMAANGLIHLPVGEIGDDAISELVTFPVGRHDDQVDADGILPRVINDTVAPFIAPVEPEKPERDWNQAHEWNASDAAWG